MVFIKKIKILLCYLKISNNLFNNILMVILIPFQQVGYFICHGEGFCKWIDSKNYFKNDFLFLEMIFVLKLILELK